MSNTIRITIKNPSQQAVDDAKGLLDSFSIDSFFHQTAPLSTDVGCDKDQFDFFEETLYINTEYSRFPSRYLLKHMSEGFFFDDGSFYGFIKNGIINCIEDQYEFNKMHEFFFREFELVKIDPLVEFQNKLSRKEEFTIEESQLISSFFFLLRREEDSPKVDNSMFKDYKSFSVFPEGQNSNNSFLKITKSVIVEPDKSFKSQYTLQSSKINITLSSFLEAMFEIRNYLTNPLNLK